MSYLISLCIYTQLEIIKRNISWGNYVAKSSQDAFGNTWTAKDRYVTFKTRPSKGKIKMIEGNIYNDGQTKIPSAFMSLLNQ